MWPFVFPIHFEESKRKEEKKWVWVWNTGGRLRDPKYYEIIKIEDFQTSTVRQNEDAGSNSGDFWINREPFEIATFREWQEKMNRPHALCCVCHRSFDVDEEAPLDLVFLHDERTSKDIDTIMTRYFFVSNVDKISYSESFVRLTLSASRSATEKWRKTLSIFAFFREPSSRVSIAMSLNFSMISSISKFSWSLEFESNAR